jgi:hypothetical protein
LARLSVDDPCIGVGDRSEMGIVPVGFKYSGHTPAIGYQTAKCFFID